MRDSNVRQEKHVETSEFGDGFAPASAVPPVAIVGMGMRLPGDVRTGDELWDLLISKRDCSSEVPKSRYNIDAFYHPDKPQSVKTRRGYFLSDDYMQGSDNSFFAEMSGFNISELDPQQMSLMEVVWECMENAGQTKWRGEKIGCYVGVFGEDWHELTAKEPQDIPRVYSFANGGFTLANRISYEFDLKGPSATILTACSSSLVALHEACQALYSGSCSSAVVAGTNMLLTPSTSVNMSENMVLSPDGYCKVFDASANGYGRGEAVNAIFIKPLDQAIADGDNIRAIIRGTSANYDGRSAKIFAPDIKSQEKLIREAYSRAQIHDISQTAFVECHGTGTQVGDIVETTAIARAFEGKGVFIGSVKSNVGHGEGASGLTAIIKAVLSLEHSTIPPNLHFTRPNPRIPFVNAGLQVPTEPTPWPLDRKKRVSVNCFGIGGSNAHVILDAGPAVDDVNRKIIDKQSIPYILPASAQSTPALISGLAGIQEYLEKKPHMTHDVAYTLGACRDHLSHRGYLIVDGKSGISENQSTPPAVTGAPHVIFAFTGQGAQWAGMGTELMNHFDTFRRDIRTLDQILQEIESPPSWSIEGELSKPDVSTCVDKTEYSQTLCAAVQITLVNLLASWGISPSAVVGYSSGEVIAAYAAKAISMRGAIIIAHLRGRCNESTSQPGGMSVIGLEKETVNQYLIDGVVIACENSPQSVNISGPRSQLRKVIDRIVERMPETFVRELPVEVAYHSPSMMNAGVLFESAIASHIAHSETMLPLYSTVTGTMITEPHRLDAAHWRKSLESPVLFSTAVQTLLDQQKDRTTLLVEIGTHSTLAGPIRQIVSPQSIQAYYIPTLIKKADPTQSILTTLGELYCHGHPVDFAAINGTGNVLHDLPVYHWDRQSIDWKESRLSHNWRFRKYPHHELLGSRMLEASDIEPGWRNFLKARAVPWLSDHQVLGDVVFPCAGYIGMINEAIRQLFNTQECTIRNLQIKVPLVVPTTEGHNIEIVTTMRPLRINDRLDSEWFEFTIACYDGNNWTKHSTGQVMAGAENLKIDVPGTQRFQRSVNTKSWYGSLAKVGLQYGPHFQGLEDITADPISFAARATVGGIFKGSDNSHAVHPTVIDQCLQMFSVAACKGRARYLTTLFIPMFIDEISLGQNSDLMKVEVTGESFAGTQAKCSVSMSDGTNMVLTMRGVTLAQLDQSLGDETFGIPLLSEAEWRPDLDLLPGHLQLPSEKDRGNTVGLLSRASTLSMICMHRNIAKVEPCPEHLESYKGWLSNQIMKLKTDGISAVPEAQTWAQMDSDNLRAQRLTLDKQLQTEGLGFISELSQVAVRELTALVEGSNCSSLASRKVKQLQKLNDWIDSLSDLLRFFSLLCHANPNLRILAIGDETGSFTSSVLQYLTSDGKVLCAQYTLATRPDIDAVLKDRFKDNNLVEFKSLDLNKDPLQQEFKGSYYDLVIALNIGARMSGVTPALKSIGKLLTPGGRVLIREHCPELPNPSLTQLFDEPQVDINAKYMSTEEWEGKLRQAGFGGVETKGDDGKAPYRIYRNLIARIPPKNHLQGNTVYLLCPSEMHRYPWLIEVETHFIGNGHTVKRCTKGEAIPHGQRVISFLDFESPFFYDTNEKDWMVFQHLMKSSPQILWVTHSVEFECANPNFSLVMGVSRTARQEQEIQFGTFQVDNFDSFAAEALLKVSTKFFRQGDRTGLDDADYEFALRDGCVYIPRIRWSSLSDRLLYSPGIDAPLKLDIASYGTLDSLSWREHELRSPEADEIEIEVKFVGLNFRDVMISLGFMASKDQMGIDGSGIVQKCGTGVTEFKKGDRVMIMHPGLFRTRVVVPTSRCIHMPPSISLEDAASLPVVYVTALYCIMDIGRLEKGQSVLIHAACGGVGLAAIQLCQMIGAKIYATVGSETKVQHLIDNFGIPRSHIFSSRDTSFYPNLMKETEGRGVDIVLNSLAGELLHASWKCVAEFGKMIEIGKRDFLEHGTLALEAFGGNRAFFGVDLIRLAEKAGTVTRLFCQVRDLWDAGKITPIRPLNIFSSIDTPEAFRQLQQGLHMGKLLVRMPEISERGLIAKSRCRSVFSPRLSYILVGGLGGIGRAIATWMIERGARNLVFLSRSAGATSQDQSFRDELELQGSTAIMIKCDVTIQQQVQAAIDACPCPVGGILQLSMIVRDTFIPDMSHKDWQDVLSSKVAGTWNLHNALDGNDANLQFFVVCGSITGVMGNAGQVNYSAANAFVSSFAQYRLQMGLPASVVNLGGVDDVGFLAAQDPTLRERMRSASVRLLSEQEVLDAFELAIFSGDFKGNSNSSDLLNIPNNLIVGMSSTKSLADATVRPLWGQDARFRAYSHLDFDPEATADASKIAPSLRYMISLLENDPDTLDGPAWKEQTMLEIANTLQQYSTFARGQDSAQLATIHIDSLMTVEIRNWCRRHFDLGLSLIAITKAATFSGLGDLITETLRSKYIKK
ncbi:hypothetical protein VN97_g10867 [Penicillium thymicola]|uniref:Carrier domain-containing protein n=1 Tax=Penicillium thymicola TaxID=293382 RepID=A0AAI9X3E9_PENTH|nr:hypothetical protein VN97_g10867 [Penicillium thymicola]